VKESTYEVPGSAGGNYILTKCEEMEVGGKAEAEKPSAAEEGQAPASKNAGAVDGKQKEKNVRVARVEEWRVEVNNAVQKVDPAENEDGGEKKKHRKCIINSWVLELHVDDHAVEKEKDVRLKKKEKHAEKSDSKHKVRRK
jgi:hypothetical protein